MTHNTPQKILVRMPNWLGDFVMATPILDLLHAAFPEAALHVHCLAPFVCLVEDHPAVEKVIAFQRGKSFWSKQRAYLNTARQLRQVNYDWGILLTNSFSSAAVMRLARCKQRIGFKGNGRDFLLTKAVNFPVDKEQRHLVEVYVELLKPMGVPAKEPTPRLYFSEREMLEAEKFLLDKGLNKEKLWIGVNPTAAYGPAKSWLPERFVELSKRLVQHDDVQLVYFGDREGKPLIDSICTEIGSDKIINIAAQTSLKQLACCIASCDFFLTNDSGPMHIAAAVRTPLLALFGSTSSVKTGPYQFGEIIHKHVECSPCYKRTCPIDFRCMKQIEVDEVLEKIEHKLSISLN